MQLLTAGKYLIGMFSKKSGTSEKWTMQYKTSRDYGTAIITVCIVLRSIRSRLPAITIRREMDTDRAAHNVEEEIRNIGIGGSVHCHEICLLCVF